jgi:hypothetical protein
VALDPPPPRAFADFGDGSWVVPPARVLGAPYIAVGASVVLMEHSELWAEPIGGSALPVVHIGDGTRFARFATVWATVGVHIGSNVLTSDYVAIADCWYPPGDVRNNAPGLASAAVIIGDGAYLGCGCFIGPGVTVGAGAYVGEGAVVWDDVPAHSVAQGNPAVACEESA